MTIAAKLRAFSLIMLLISVAFGYSFSQTSAHLKNQRTVNNIIQAIIKKTFEFSIITNEYIENKTPRIESQWGNTHASLEKLFTQASKTLYFHDDINSLKKIIANEVQAEELLLVLISKELNTQKYSQAPIHERKTTQMISQIRIRVQGILSETSRMSRRSLERLITAEQQLERTFSLLIFVYFSFFIISLVLIQKKNNKAYC